MFAASVHCSFVHRTSRLATCLAVVGVLLPLFPLAAAHATTVAPVAVPDRSAAIGRSLPTVSTSPRSLVVVAGNAAVFDVVVGSSTPVTYQWMRDGTKIPGATATSYTLTAAALSDTGASFSVVSQNSVGSVTSDVARLTVNAVISAQAVSASRPFSDQSPWNARPTKFTLGSVGVPKSLYYPNVSEGAYSLGVYAAAATDTAVVVRGENGGYLWVPDAEAAVPSIVVPHWPAGVVPALGDDGHADIIDPANNLIHSFWQLKLVGGQWTASAYATSALDGRGFGTPGQPMQGARAAGVPSLAGLMRKGEVNDGAPSYRHALAMSLTFNALAATPAFAFPATAADWDAGSTNSGTVPEGALMMVPTSFDTSVIKDARLLKIVKTLQTFGAYVVDRNYGTPFAIYVENGAGFNLMPSGWNNEIASELEVIRLALRQVVATTEWVDANGAVFTPETNLNLLSMRGYWSMQTGSTVGQFDTGLQAVVFANDGISTTQVNSTGRSMPTAFTPGIAGKSYTFKVVASGNATLKLDLMSPTGKVIYSSGKLANGMTATFVWPTAGLKPQLTASSGATGGGKVSASLVVAP